MRKANKATELVIRDIIDHIESMKGEYQFEVQGALYFKNGDEITIVTLDEIHEMARLHIAENLKLNSIKLRSDMPLH